MARPGTKPTMACGKCPYRPIGPDDKLEAHCFECAYTGYLYVRGCRCDGCRTASRNRQYRQKKIRQKRLAKDMTLANHGQASTYMNWGCRCEPCTTAHSARCVLYARRRRQNGGERLFPDGWTVEEVGFRRVVTSV